MKNILKIYSKYKIMPSLGEHQLRVAAVAKQICDSISKSLDVNGVVNVCLVHDMGNIIKSDLMYFPDFLEPEGLEYWQTIKDTFIEKYGANEHIATEIIAKEIGLSDIKLKYLSTIGFSKIKLVLKKGTIEQKICCYADQRVGPYGVLSIEKRIKEGKKRYTGIKNNNMAITIEKYENLVLSLKELEKQVFSHSSILPRNINDESIKSIILELKK